MLDKEQFGYLSMAFLVAARVPYFWSIFQGKTKPHLFTWTVWSLLTVIATAALYAGNAGPGMWATALTALTCVMVALLSLKYGEKNITRSDWFFFGAALAIIPLWKLTESPLTAIALVTLIDVIAYLPTFRKSYVNPHEEMIWNFLVGNLKHLASLLAMSVYTLTTVLYPAIIFLMNGALVGMLIYRRRAAGCPRGHKFK